MEWIYHESTKERKHENNNSSIIFRAFVMKIFPKFRK
jgi:hypothetical protein